MTPHLTPYAELGASQDPRSRSSELLRNFTEYAPSHSSSPFFSKTLFCKQNEVNSEIIFAPISKYDLGYHVVNDIKYHFWLNAYLVKELH